MTGSSDGVEVKHTKAVEAVNERWERGIERVDRIPKHLRDAPDDEYALWLTKDGEYDEDEWIYLSEKDARDLHAILSTILTSRPSPREARINSTFDPCPHHDPIRQLLPKSLDLWVCETCGHVCDNERPPVCPRTLTTSGAASLPVPPRDERRFKVGDRVRVDGRIGRIEPRTVSGTPFPNQVVFDDGAVPMIGIYKDDEIEPADAPVDRSNAAYANGEEAEREAAQLYIDTLADGAERTRLRAHDFTEGWLARARTK